MVYGFVKQSGGHVAIYSEEGCGTTIRLYLPQAASAALPTPAEANSAVAGGTETILAVEDDELVRNYVIAQLHSLGYTTHVAANAAEALAIVARGTPFDLLFTDIVMPGAMNGRALAEEVLRRHPQMRVLFTSGYTEEVALRDRLEQGVNLLSKPYRKADLARKIREVLDAPPPASV
jgi:CheY-like chemotaxis protein